MRAYGKGGDPGLKLAAWRGADGAGAGRVGVAVVGVGVARL